MSFIDNDLIPQMEKSAQPGENGGCTPNPFTISTVMYKVVVYAPAERADTFPLFLLYSYMYSVLDPIAPHVTLANPSPFRARIFKRVWGPGIDSKE
jgi:hypothetical protein